MFDSPGFELRPLVETGDFFAFQPQTITTAMFTLTPFCDITKNLHCLLEFWRIFIPARLAMSLKMSHDESQL